MQARGPSLLRAPAAKVAALAGAVSVTSGARVCWRSLSRRAVLFCLVVLALAIPAPAQQPPTAEPEPAVTPALRAADDAFQNLVDKVLSLRFEDGRTTVAEALLPRSPAGNVSEPADAVERALRQKLLEEYQRSALRPTLGGGVEVDAWLSTVRLNEILRSVLKLPGLTLHTGTGPTVTATGRYVPDGRPRDHRPGWRQCSPEQIVQTRDAAQLDVRRRLFNRIALMRLEGDQRIRELLVRFPRFREALARRVDAVPLGDPTFEPIGVCRLRLTISRDEVRALVQAAAAESRERELPAGLADLSDPLGEAPIVIQGFAVPPPYVPPPTRSKPLADPNRPEWADGLRSAKGTGIAPPGVQDEQTRRTLALKAARIEAARLLWLEIEKLPLSGGTVGDLLAGHPRAGQIAAQIDMRMVPVSSPSFDADGRATVTLGISLESLWTIVRDLR
ncbi:MAG TPA: hypothetical protein PKG54_19235 [Phycisphaerae bacterium]|nr:hypothetical protein [Phycisphaerae bacterium]HOJ56667.1 hypothetical protein [Phycisphaerae bacterium]HOL28452.1 hypothetical protein [Phycisphaerae bacterium]HPP22947.1 hypothetical protein [Phycisphaerae bacterium]HPU34934.1 hypothetical protein [Phycisphaerae bacterium]